MQVSFQSLAYQSGAYVLRCLLQDIDKNQIGSEGVLHLYKTTWKLAKGLALCMHFFIKAIIGLG